MTGGQPGRALSRARGSASSGGAAPLRWPAAGGARGRRRKLSLARQALDKRKKRSGRTRFDLFFVERPIALSITAEDHRHLPVCPTSSKTFPVPPVSEGQAAALTLNLAPPTKEGDLDGRQGSAAHAKKRKLANGRGAQVADSTRVNHDMCSQAGLCSTVSADSRGGGSSVCFTAQHVARPSDQQAS